jgi:hypothetical protein
MPKLQEKPSALKRELPALQNMKILYFLLFLWVFFVLLDPDPAAQINADPQPRILVYSTHAWLAPFHQSHAARRLILFSSPGYSIQVLVYSAHPWLALPLKSHAALPYRL